MMMSSLEQKINSKTKHTRRPRRPKILFCLVPLACLFVMNQRRRPSTTVFQLATTISAGTVSMTTTHDIPRLQQRLTNHLCPNGRIPNLTAAPLLFAMARKYLGIEESATDETNTTGTTNTTTSNSRRIPPLFTRFYSGEFERSYVYQQHHQSETQTHTQNHTLVYVRIWKAGNNQIRQWMNETLGDYGTLKESKLSTIAKQPQPQHHSTDEICLVTAIRDPIQHFLSGYNEIEYRRNPEFFPEFYSKRQKPPKYFRMPHKTHQQRQERFVEFVHDLVHHTAIFSNLQYMHVFSMSRVLSALDQNNLSLTAYLPSLDHLDEDFPTMIRQECPFEAFWPQQHNQQQQQPTHHIQPSQHNSSKDPEGFYQAAKEVVAQNPTLTRALCALHAMDYACWTKLWTTPQGIPKLCQELYQSEDFWELLEQL